MKRTHLIIVIALCIMAAALLGSSPKVKAAANLSVISSSMLTDTEYQGGSSSVTVTHIVGEVQNTGDQPGIPSAITATFYDASSNVLTQNSYDQTSGSMTMGGMSSIVMLPGAKIPFDVQITSSVVDHYTLSVSDLGYNATRDNRPQMLQVISSNFYVDTYLSSPSRTVNGTISNTGSSTATSPYVWVTFYDSNGTVVEMSLAYTNPSDLNAGSAGTFEVHVYRSQTQLPKIASYRVTVQSTEYTAVSEQTVTIPEFTTILTPLILAVIIATAIVFYKRRTATRACPRSVRLC